jgi:hypothetical protein
VGSYSYVEGSAFTLGVSAVQLRVEDFWSFYRTNKFYASKEEVDKAIEEFEKMVQKRSAESFPYRIFDDLV